MQQVRLAECGQHLQCFSPEVDPRLTGFNNLLFDSARLTMTLPLLTLVIYSTTAIISFAAFSS